MRKRIAYSQNFLKSNELVAKLIETTSITVEDVVYEIGAGQGIITQELLKKSNKVIAFEIDENLVKKIKAKLGSHDNLEIIQGDFLNYKLPNKPYKVFSNIPFNISSAVIKKLTEAPQPPNDAYLIVQKETAQKFAGKPADKINSQMAILLKPWFELKIIHSFQRSDYFPKPSVDTVLLAITKKERPLIVTSNKNNFQDFVVYTFNQFKPNVIEGLSGLFGKENISRLSKELNFPPNSKPSELGINHWLGLFQNLESSKMFIINGSYSKLKKQQKSLEKIHRTRLDKNWKNYK